MVDINALLPEGMPEEASGVKECLINGGLGGLIDWDYWARFNDIKPEEAAKLAYYINPKVQDKHIDSQSLKFRGDLCKEINKLSEWLEERSKKWTLTELILALESEECRCYDIKPPYGMIQAVEPNPPETLLRKEARLSAAQTLGLDVSKNTHYFFPPALRAKRIARLQYPFDKAKQSEFTRQIETTLNRSNPESDYHATYSAADVNRLLRMKLYNKPSEHIRAWHNATQPPPPIGTAEPDTTPRQERELTQWMRKTWEAEGKPNGSAFFSRLKKYANTKGSPITQHYTVGGKSGGGVGWKTSKTNGERTKASIVNMVSRFKNEDKAKQTGST